MSSSHQDFKRFAYGLVNQEVEVITSEGTYTGTLLSVGGDSIILRRRIRGRSERLAIRIAQIVALSRFATSPRGPFWAQSSERGPRSSDSNDGNVQR